MSRMRKRTHDGFSLVEVLIAVVVLAIAGAALLRLLNGTIFANRTLTDRSLALVTLNQSATQIQTIPFVPCRVDNKDQIISLYSQNLPKEIEVISVDAFFDSSNAESCTSDVTWRTGTRPDPILVKVKIGVEVSNKYVPGGTELLTREVFKTSQGLNTNSTAKVTPTPTSATIWRVNDSDSSSSRPNSVNIQLRVDPYRCDDVFIWGSGDTNGVSLTLNSATCVATIKTLRDPAQFPWPRSAILNFSAVEFSTKTTLGTGSVSILISDPTPVITGFVVSNPVGGHSCIQPCLQSGLVGNDVTITGRYLLGNAAGTLPTPVVRFSPSQNATVRSSTDTSIVATVPSSTQDGPLTVVSAGGSVESSSSFTLIPLVDFDETHQWVDPDTALTITNSFEPQGASPRLAITVFTTGNSEFISNVLFSPNVSAASITYLTTNSVSVVVPTGVVRGPLKIVTAAGTTTSLKDFFPVPKISSLKDCDASSCQSSASVTSYVGTSYGGYGSGITGRAIMVLGSGLSAISKIQFSGPGGSWIDATNCNYTGNRESAPTHYFLDTNLTRKDSRIAVCVPIGTVTGPIRAFNDIGEGISPWDFHPEPIVLSTSVQGAGLGRPVTISGSGFTGLTRISFGGTTATIPASYTDTSITVNVPSGANDGPIVITTPAGTANSSTFYVKPRIISYSSSLSGSTNTLTFTGTGFTSGSSATVGGAALTNLTWTSDTTFSGKLTCSTPLGSQNLVVTTPLGINPSPYTLSLPAPTIASLSVVGAGLGRPVTISGSGFTCMNNISFGGTTATIPASYTDTSITVNVPSGANDGPIVITTPAGTANSSTFYVKPRITSVSGTSGISNTLTFTGTGFTSGSSATVGGAALTNLTWTSDTTFSGKLTCSTPLGSQNLVVTTPLGINSAYSLAVSGTAASITTYGSNNSGNDKKYQSSGTLRISGTDLSCIDAIRWQGITLSSFSGGSTALSATLPASTALPTPPPSAPLEFGTSGSFTSISSPANVLWVTPVLNSSTSAVELDPSNTNNQLYSFTVQPASNPCGGSTSSCSASGGPGTATSGSVNITGIVASNVTSLKSGSNTVITVRYVASSQRFTAGQTVTLSGLSSGFNGTWTIQTAPSSTILAAFRNSSRLTLRGSGFSGFLSGSTCPSGYSIMFGSTEISCSNLNPSSFTDTSITFTMPSSTFVTSTGLTSISVKTPFGTSTNSISIWIT